MRAPLLLLLLLMAGAGLAVSPLARLNPWLSACDLEVGGGGAGRCGEPQCGAVEVLTEHDLPQLCRLPPVNRTRRLATLRLRACCERSLTSALDLSARAVVLAGNKPCESTLRDLLELDAMVARVHCEFADILERYDCDRPYSIHTCRVCQETYRRWACSTMVPLWVEEGEESSGRSRRAGGERAVARWRARHLERVGHLDRRRRRGTLLGRWVRSAAAGPGRPLARLKPCLSVCQLVEQHCPYFLPADRAPAYPTQYAGEPTFLCLDERIPETGGQANRSNYGPEECCYWYCEKKLCYRCSVPLGRTTHWEPERCEPVEERVSQCSVPAAASLHRPLPLLAGVTVLALLLLSRTHDTAPVPIVNVCDDHL